MNGAQKLVQSLIKNKTEVLFGLPGGATVPMFDALLEQDKMKFILVRHEQCAAHMADGYARATGKVGVCTATSGPGATNLVTGIATAYMDSSPIIAIAGQVPKKVIGTDAFQESDMFGITMPVVKHNYQLWDADFVEECINSSFKIALTGRPGPVFIDFMKSAQIQETKKNYKNPIELEGFKPKTEGNTNQIIRAAKEIAKAERPLILAGGGTIWSNSSPEIKQLSESLKAPVITTLMGKTVFDETSPLSYGMTGMHGAKKANWALLNSDLIIAVGTRFSDRVTGSLECFNLDAKIIHIDIDPAELGKNVKFSIPIVGDAKQILKKIIEQLKKETNKKENRWKEKNKEYAEIKTQNNKASKLSPKKAMQKINKLLGEKDIVTTGVGQHQMLAANNIIRKIPRTFITSGGLGTMGFGFPAAIGAKAAMQEREVWDIDGDGSFLMTCQELATCKQHNIKVIPIIFNNGYLGMVKQWQDTFLEKRYSGVKLGNSPDFAKMAESFGLNGIVVEKETQIEPAMKEAIKNKETTVIDLRIDEKANVMQMFNPTESIYDSQGKFFQEKKWCFKYE